MIHRSASALLAVFCLISGLASAQDPLPNKVEFPNGWGAAGYTVVSQSETGVEVVFSIPEIYFSELAVNGETFTSVNIPLATLSNDAGFPNLPGVGRFVAIPRGAKVGLKIIESRSRVFQNVNILPAPPIQSDNDDSPPVYEKNTAIYGADSYYPAAPVRLSEPARLRGVDAVVLGITPFSYNPVKKELVAYSDFRVRVEFEGGLGTFGEDAYRNRWFEPLLEEHLLNYATLPAVDFSRRSAGRGEECEYMIFIPNKPEFQTWAEVIQEFRTKQGIITNIFNIADLGGTATAIENKINSAYNNWTLKPVAALMLGDLPDMPVHTVTGSYYSMLSDNKYADVDNDSLPDINVARITARDNADLSLMINKFIDYETNPPTDPGFYNEPIIAGGWQSDRWFILCSDVVWGYFANEQAKSPAREYAGYTSGQAPPYWSTNQNTDMIISYFGPTGLGYIPSTPSHLTDWGGNAARINSDINSGAFWLLHRDHGSEDGWGSPAYSTSDLSALTNTDLTFVLTINCLTGKYDYSPQCFTEAFHRMSTGALGLIAASNVSYSFVNDTFVWGLHDAMWPDFDPGYGGSTGENLMLPGFAHASGKWYLEASSWPYNEDNKFDTYHLFHMHGDAFCLVYSEVPQNLSVAHASTIDNTATSFTVTADAGSLIALSANGAVLGTAEGTGSPVAVMITPPTLPGFMYVTVTKPNFYRYEAQVAIITGGALAIWPPEGIPESVLPGPVTDIPVMIVNGVETYVPGTGRVHYRFDPADPFDSALLAPIGGDVYNAEVPGARPDSQPEFYFSAEGDGGTTVTCPSDAPATTFAMSLEGLLEILMVDDFEVEQGWTVQNTAITTGAFERVDPLQVYDSSYGTTQPGDDHTPAPGIMCYITENGYAGQTVGTADVDGGPTELISPVLHLAGSDADVSYYVWHYNDDGDDPFQVSVSSNNGSTWIPVQTINGAAWDLGCFTVSDYITPTDQVRVRFSVSDNPNDSITEAGVDDFSVARINMSPSIWAGAYSICASEGCSLPLYVDAGPAYAGRHYLVVGGWSGSYPGTVLPSGKVLPLNRDNLTDIILGHLNKPRWQNFDGYLDGDGEAVATFNSLGPIPSAHVGKTLTFAFTLKNGFDLVSNPVAIVIEP